MTPAHDVDAIVIGAGVVGIAVARALQLAGRAVVLAEREARFGMGTSSRNSEVIHAGIYYSPGSLKARLCVEGRGLLYDYCRQRNVVHRRTGKLIVAVTDGEATKLEDYHRTADANGAGTLESLDGRQVQALEPAVRGVAGLLSPETGIIDSHGLMAALLADFEGAGGFYAPRTTIRSDEVQGDGAFLLILDDADETRLRARTLVNAAGLHAPDLARSLAGFPAHLTPDAHYAIGHYFQLTGRSPFNRLVYPVAQPGGLGVHVTLDLAGTAQFGPDVRWIDRIDYRFDESRKPAFVEAIRRYYPALDPDRLEPAYTGIRPKIVGPGEPDADFLIQGRQAHGIPGLVNLFGIESPGLTASLAIARHVTEMLG